MSSSVTYTEAIYDLTNDKIKYPQKEKYTYGFV
jgi:hypothetical protein